MVKILSTIFWWEPRTHTILTMNFWLFKWGNIVEDSISFFLWFFNFCLSFSFFEFNLFVTDLINSFHQSMSGFICLTLLLILEKSNFIISNHKKYYSPWVPIRVSDPPCNDNLIDVHVQPENIFLAKWLKSMSGYLFLSKLSDIFSILILVLDSLLSQFGCKCLLIV